jgi:hypothetical protein
MILCRLGQQIATRNVTIVPQAIHHGNCIIGSHFGGT